MKRILLFFVLAITVAAAAVGAEPSAKKGKARIEFAKRSIDFGTVHENDGKVLCDFAFTNTGDMPLVIISAEAQCGCTKPSYPDAPIAPGQSGVISVTFNPSHQRGEIGKTVKVRTNDDKHKRVVLKITGVVIP